MECTLYNLQNQKIAVASKSVNVFENDVYHKLIFDTDVESGEQYYFAIQLVDCQNEGIRVLYGENRKIGLEENKEAYLGGRKLPEYSTMAIYGYRTDLSIDKIAMYDIWFVMMAFIADDFLVKLVKKEKKDAESEKKDS